MSNILHRPLRLPLHIPVAVLFSLLILGVGASISLYHFHETRLLLEAANDRMFQTLADDTRTVLSEAESAVRRSFVLLSASPLADAEGYAERFRFLPELTGLVSADPLIDSVMVGYGDGSFLLVQRAVGPAGPEGEAAWTVFDASTTNGAQQAAPPRLYHFDRDLRFLGTSEASTFEPRLTDWYRRAASSDVLVVTPPYAFQHSGDRGITFARRNGSAVLGINVRFGAMSSLMARQRTTPSTRMRLQADDGSVLAELVTRGNTPQAAGDEVINQATNALRSDAASTRTVADAAGRTWHTSLAPLPGFGAGGWTLAVTAPDDEIFAEAYRQRQRSVLFTVAAVLLSFPLAWLLSRLLTRPLHQLSGVARLVSSLQFQPQAQTHSVILEVDQLAGAIALMRTTIARFLELGHDLGATRDLQSLLLNVRTGAREVARVPWCTVRVFASHPNTAAWAGANDEAPFADEFDEAALSDLQALGDGPLSLRMPSADGIDWHLLLVPLRTGEGQILGALALADRLAPSCSLQHSEVVGFLSALAGSAALALENQRLLDGRRELLHGVLRLVAEAIDAKSPYTGVHCRRVPQIATRLARAADATEKGPLATYRLDASSWEALQIAAWMHDCGKLTTPEHVIDKATKLETLYNRIHEIRMRFEVLKRDAEIAYWKDIARGQSERPLRTQLDSILQRLDEEFAFVAWCNRGQDGMTSADIERLGQIAKRRWTRTLDDRLGLSNAELKRRTGLPAAPLPVQEPLLADRPEHVVPRIDNERFLPGNPWGFAMRAPAALYDRGELHNLSIERGTLTAEERFKINEHIVETIVMLERLPFPPDLAGVPEMAGGHHETMDGRGYPRGLCAADMSVNARIIAIADIFEALTASDRPYKTANSVPEALAIMRTMCGRRMIDPDLFDLFVTSLAWKDHSALSDGDGTLAPRTPDSTDSTSACLDASAPCSSPMA